MQKLFTTCIFVGMLAATTAFAGNDDFDIRWHTIDGGGGYAFGGDFDLEVTIGQPDAGQTLTGGDYELSGGFWFPTPAPPADEVHIVGAKSLLLHDDPGVTLAIDLDDANGIEPRAGGPAMLAFEMDQEMDIDTVVAGNVQVNCATGPAPTVLNAMVINLDTVHIDIEAMTSLDCCSFAFSGMLSISGAGVTDTYHVSRIDGDMDFSGAVTGGDAAIIKPHFGEIVGVDLNEPQWDFDRNGGVTGGDYALIKPLFGDIGASCP